MFDSTYDHGRNFAMVGVEDGLFHAMGLEKRRCAISSHAKCCDGGSINSGGEEGCVDNFRGAIGDSWV